MQPIPEQEVDPVGKANLGPEGAPRGPPRQKTTQPWLDPHANYSPRPCPAVNLLSSSRMDAITKYSRRSGGKGCLASSAPVWLRTHCRSPANSDKTRRGGAVLVTMPLPACPGIEGAQKAYNKGIWVEMITNQIKQLPIRKP